MTMLQSVLDFLRLPTQKPEYLHVLLNAYPTHGIPLGIAALTIAFWLRSRQARIVGLFILFLSGLSAWPVYQSGERASDRISANADDETEAWLEEHEHRAENLIPLFYIVAGTSLLAIAAPKFKASAEMPLTYLSFVVSLSLLGAGGYIAYAGGKIAHPEFRVGPPDAPQAANAREILTR